MKVRVWGARGSLPSPLSPDAVREKVISVLQGARDVDLSDPLSVRAYVDDLHPVMSGTAGGNTPCVEVDADNKKIIIDAGSGIRELGYELMKGPWGKGQGEIHLFMSHTHWDHIQGLPFFLPAYVPGNKLFIYSIHDVEDTLRQQMKPATFPVPFDYMANLAAFEFISLRVGQRLELGDVTVSNLRLPHPGDAYGFRIDWDGKSVVYASDAEYKKLDENTTQPFVRFYTGADVLFFDSQFSLRESLIKEDWGHSSSLIGADLARRAMVKNLVLFHHDPTTSDLELLRILEETRQYQQQHEAIPYTEVFIGREGLTFNLGDSDLFELDWQPEKDTVVLKITQEFDQETVSHVLNQINSFEQPDDAIASEIEFPRLIVDLSNVGQLSISGLRSLIDLNRLWEGRSLALAGLNQASRHVLELANFIDMFVIYPTVEAALASLEALDTLAAKGELMENRYRIEEKLGESESSVIFRATDTRLERPVTLKVLTPKLNQSAIMRVLLQAKKMARLRAPNIVTIYDWDEDWGMAYLVQEFVGNQTLRDALRKGGKYNPFDVAINILTALEYAHSRGAVHGNLKPANVIIADEIKLTDFGFWWSDEGVPLTESQFSFGDPAYLAPEQVLGKPIDARVDLYAFGLILYELFTGVKPFTGTAKEKLEKRLHESPVAPQEINPNISKTLDHLIMKLLAFNPDDRYDSAAQVKRILLSMQVASQVNISEDGQIDSLPIGRQISRPIGLQHKSLELVGRESDLEKILHLWSDARQANGQVVLISGEAGVGKSFLAKRASEKVEGVVLFGQCSELAGGIPYQPFVEIIYDYLSSELMTNPVDLLGDSAPVIASIVPQIHQFIPDLPELADIAPEQARSRLVRSVFDFIARATVEMPWCIIIDNLHFADAATLQMLFYISRNLNKIPLMIIGLYRDDDLAATHPLRELDQAMRPYDYYHRIKVNPLDIEPVKRVLRDVWQQDVPEDWLQAIYERTGGNPFYIYEVVKDLTDEKSVYFRDGRWHFKPVISVKLPKSIRDLILRRVSRLDTDAQSILRQAAVLGQKFVLSDMLAVCQHPEDQMLDIMDMLLERDFIREEDGGKVMVFDSSDIYQTIYDDLSGHRLQALHEHVGAVLEEKYPGKLEKAAQLAHHFIKAGNRESGIRYGLMAAKHAQSIFAFQNALHWYNQIVRLAPQGREEADLRVDLYEGLGTILQVQANYADASEAFHSMQRAANEADDRMAQARALLGMAKVQHALGDHRNALSVIRRAAQIAEDAGSTESYIKTLIVQGDILYHLGELDQAVETAERARGISQKEESRDGIAQSMSLLGILNSALGNYDTAMGFLHESHKLYKVLDNRNEVSKVLNNLGECCRMRGDYESAVNYYLEALDIANEIDNLGAVIAYQSNLGGARIGTGNYIAAETDLRKVIQSIGASGWNGLAETYVWLGEACLHLFKINDALAAAEKALSLGEEREQPNYIGQAWRALGMISGFSKKPITIGERRYTGRLNGAQDGQLVRSRYTGQLKDYLPEDCFRQSMQIFQEMGMAAEQARTLREWSHYESTQNRTESAEEKWQEALKLFMQLRMDSEVARMMKATDSSE